MSEDKFPEKGWGYVVLLILIVYGFVQFLKWVVSMVS